MSVFNTLSKEDRERLFAKVRAIRKNKKSPVKYLCHTEGFTAQEALELLHSFRGVENPVPLAAPVVETESTDDQLEFHSDKYVYNKATDTYIVPLRSAPKPLVIKGEIHRAIVSNYSSLLGPSLSINQICAKFKIPRQYFNEYKAVFGLTHDREPLTSEEISTTLVDDAVGSLLEKKRHAILQKFEKENWRIIQEEALMWRAFKAKELDPLKNFLENWNPPPYIPIPTPAATVDDNRYFLAVVSDVHFGARASAQKTWKGKGASTEETVRCVQNYASQIKRDVLDRKSGFKRCVVISNGDICHSLSGFTDKGTPLKYDCLRETQFEYAFDCVKAYLEKMLEIFETVDVHSVVGNHAGFMDWVLFEALKAYFRNEARINITNYKTQYAAFRLGKALIVAWHGYSSEYHTRLPQAGPKRESFLQNVLLTHPELLVGTTARIVVTSDLHHIEQKEFSNFHHIMTSCVLSDDEYADSMGYTTRASQQCFVVDESGLKETLNYYLE